MSHICEILKRGWRFNNCLGKVAIFTIATLNIQYISTLTLNPMYSIVTLIQGFGFPL